MAEQDKDGRDEQIAGGYRIRMAEQDKDGRDDQIAGGYRIRMVEMIRQLVDMCLWDKDLFHVKHS